MGSWSVSCGISNIAITYGNKCCIVPLIESIYDYGGYVPATLPIFGEYNDYGGMENIVEDENTKLIESNLGITIAELVEFLVDGEHTYDRREVKPIAKKLEDNGKLDELSKWRFMWIDCQVYEVMSKNYDTWQKGHHDYGTPEMLALLGFTEVEGAEINNYDPKRFNKKYQRGDLFVYSDGRTMLSEKNHYIYYTNKGCKSSIMTYMQLPEELQYLKDKTSREVWRLMSPKKCKEQLSGVFGDRQNYYDDFDDEVNNILNERIEKLIAEGQEVPQILRDRVKKITKKINQLYFNNLEVFGDLMVGLTNVRGNMHPMSGRWYPHVLYLTPQCGEYRLHQILLEEFARINKSYVQEYDDEE
jgi:hypothetical protein